MTLNANKPEDQVLVAELATYQREARAAINAISGSGNVGVTTLTVPAGTTQLVVGTNLGSYGFETVIISGAAALTIASILGGTSGQVKLFIFQDNNISLADGPKLTGQLYLNHLPALSDYNPQQDAVLALVNVGGDGGATTHGYWKELFRTTPVK